jgi:hypothetical protein
MLMPWWSTGEAKTAASYSAMLAVTMSGVVAGRVSMPRRPINPHLAVASASPTLR